MKTRSSSGVGAKVDLEFNVDSLRITDLDEDDADTNTYNTSSGSNSIANVLKRTSSNTQQGESNDDPSQGSTVGKIKAEADSTKLKQFLNNLGTE
jgi:hypothetical protein